MGGDAPALFAHARLHGRNAATWNIKGATSASDRFDYDYPADELGSIAERARELTFQVPDVHVVFNNNQEDQGQRNARALIERLAAAGDSIGASATRPD